jgi:flagellar FliL protein
MAKVMNNEEQVRPAAPAKSGGKGMLLLGVGLLLVIAAGVGGYFVFAGRSAASAEHGATGAEHGSSAAGDIYYAMDPPFIVNFEIPAPVRFLQVTVEIMAHEQSAIDAVQKHMPVIRNNLMMLFSGQDYQVIRTREGKEALRARTLAEIQSILKQRTGKPGIEAVYFTSFVMQ